MPITTEGIKINTELEALSPDEGFIVRFKTSMEGTTHEKRVAEKKAIDMGILGTRLNSHRSTFSECMTLLGNEVTEFKNEITQFITDWNNGDISGSPNQTQ